jgi:hypothetical protein
VTVSAANDDDEHLRLLSVFHYVVASLAALFALIPVIHLVMGLLMVTGRFGASGSGAGEELWFGWFFVIFATVWIVCGMSFAACLAFAGKFLRERRRYSYCLVVAGVACMFTPFGTVLGVFTILVLMRPSVKASFGSAAVR